MIAFSIGSINIYRYGIMYLIGFSVGYLFLRFIGKKGYAKKWPAIHTVLTKRLDDFFIAIVIGGIVGGRLGDVLIYQLPYYIQNPDQIVAVRNGGMSFIGGIIGALLAIFYVARKWKLRKQDILRMLDHMAVIAPFGIMLGRIGNFLNKELYGLVAYNKAVLSSITNDAWFTLRDNILFMRADIYQKLESLYLIYDYGTSEQFTNEMRINTNFLASFGEGLLILIILQIIYRTSYRKGKNKPGTIAFSFLLIYSLVRFFLEYLRQDSQSYYRGPLTNSQWFFVFFFGVAIVFLFTKNKNTSSSK